MNPRITPPTDGVTAVSRDVDGAVGMAENHWFVAIVNHNSELSTADRLTALGVEAFAASQKELRVWANGRRKMVDRVVIPSMVFVCCSEQQRRKLVNMPFIYRFLSDKAGTAGKVAIIPDAQIRMLRFMLGNADSPVELVDRCYAAGDSIRVVRGKLRGAEGLVIASPNGRGELLVSLGILGCARCSISLSDVEPIEE